MLLRINFKDNDFAVPVHDACFKMMYRIANGASGSDAFAEYQKTKEKYNLERIRQGLVYATLGFLIVSDACDLYEKPERDNLDQDFLIEYLDKNIEIEEVKKINPNDSDHENCYIDFFRLEVFLV